MIWFTLALFAISFLVTALLAPKPKTEDARPSNLDDIGFPQSSEGSPIALLLGSCRLKGPNTLWYGDFESVAIKKKVKTGLFSSKKVVVGYKYYLGLALGLCLGPGVVLKRVWIEKDEVWSGTAGPDPEAISINKPSLFGGDEKGGGFVSTLRFYGGAFAQAGNAYLNGQVSPDVMPSYVGQSYLVLEKAYIGTAAQLKAFSFELARYTNGLALTGGKNIVGEDLNPAELIYQLMTLDWGGLSVDSGEIDLASFQAVADTLYDEGNGMSLIISRANSGKDAIEEVLRQIDGVMYQDPSTGKIILDLIREDYALEELTVLDETNIAAVRNFSRTSWEDTFNQVRVTFTNRSNKFEKGSAIVQDLANINSQQRLRSTNLSFPGCTSGQLAVELATREMTQLSVPLFKATLEVNRTASQLRPGEAFIFSWPEYGIEQVIMRVQRFNLGELVDGRIVIDCVQDEFAVEQTIFAPPEDTLHEDIDRTAAAIATAKLSEVPYWIAREGGLVPTTSNRTFMMVNARNPGAYQQGYTATIEQGSTSAVAVDHLPYPDTALLNTAFDRLAGFSTGLTSIVIKEPSDSGEWLSAAATADTKAGANLFLLGNELMSFESFVDNLNGTWTLNNVRRGLLDTRAVDHSVDEVLYMLTADPVSESEWLGTTAAVAKLQSFTDRDETLYADASSVGLTPNRRYERPLPPDYLTWATSRAPSTVTTAGPHTVDWRPRSRLTSTIQSEADAADTEEGGVTYTLRLYLNGVLQGGSTQTGLASPTASVTLTSGWNGTVRIEVVAVRDSLESYTAGFIEVPVNVP